MPEGAVEVEKAVELAVAVMEGGATAEEEMVVILKQTH